MSKRDEREYEIAKQQLALGRDAATIRINDLLDKGLAYHEWMWNDDPEVTAARRAYLLEHPAEFKARWASSNMFVRIAAATAAMRAREHPVTATRNITPEQLTRLGLSQEQIAKLAGMEDYATEEKPGEPEDIVVSEGRRPAEAGRGRSAQHEARWASKRNRRVSKSQTETINQEGEITNGSEKELRYERGTEARGRGVDVDEEVRGRDPQNDAKAQDARQTLEAE